MCEWNLSLLLLFIAYNRDNGGVELSCALSSLKCRPLFNKFLAPTKGEKKCWKHIKTLRHKQFVPQWHTLTLVFSLHNRSNILRCDLKKRFYRKIWFNFFGETNSDTRLNKIVTPQKFQTRCHFFKYVIVEWLLLIQLAETIFLWFCQILHCAGM